MHRFLKWMCLVLCLTVLPGAGSAGIEVYQGTGLKTGAGEYDLSLMGAAVLLEIGANGDGLLFVGQERTVLGESSPDGGDSAGESGRWTLVRDGGDRVEIRGGSLSFFLERTDMQVLRCTGVLYAGLTVRPVDLGMNAVELMLAPDGTAMVHDMRSGEAMNGSWKEEDGGIRLDAGETVFLSGTEDGRWEMPLDREGTLAVFEKDAPFVHEESSEKSPEIWVLFAPDSGEREHARILLILSGEMEATWIDRERTMAGRLQDGTLTLENGGTYLCREEEGELLVFPDGGENDSMVFVRLVDGFDMDFPFAEMQECDIPG